MAWCFEEEVARIAKEHYPQALERLHAMMNKTPESSPQKKARPLVPTLVEGNETIKTSAPSPPSKPSSDPRLAHRSVASPPSSKPTSADPRLANRKASIDSRLENKTPQPSATKPTASAPGKNAASTSTRGITVPQITSMRTTSKPPNITKPTQGTNSSAGQALSPAKQSNATPDGPSQAGPLRVSIPPSSSHPQLVTDSALRQATANTSPTDISSPQTAVMRTTSNSPMTIEPMQGVDSPAHRASTATVARQPAGNTSPMDVSSPRTAPMTTTTSNSINQPVRRASTAAVPRKIAARTSPMDTSSPHTATMGASFNSSISIKPMQEMKSQTSRSLAPTKQGNATSDVASPAVMSVPAPPTQPRSHLLVSRVIEDDIPNDGPLWYQKLERVNVRDKNQTDADIKLKSLKECIRQCKQATRCEWTGRYPDHASRFQQIRDNLHHIAFMKVTPQLLRNESMLHAKSGLPQLFVKPLQGGVPFPFDIRADAREQYNKWSRGIFETDLARGLILGRAKRSIGSRDPAEDGSRTRFDPNYPDRVSANYFGQGELVNGQWWPLWHAAVRDGAHGEIMAGIWGKLEEGGAMSVVLSGGRDYDDEDNGNWLWYCGTESSDSQPTDATKMLLKSEESGVPVRLLRSHAAKWKSQYAPLQGLRYDGLYRVVTHEERTTRPLGRTRYRFGLERLRDQEPIRYEGRQQRPTPQELQAYDNIRRAQGYP